NLITVDWDSEPVPNQDVTVVFAEHTWYSVKKLAEDGLYYWESSYADTPVFTGTVETDSQGLAAVAFTPEKGGTYKITATGTDETGNEIVSTTFMWVSGREYVTWRQENNDRIELVADKREYQVGDIASILIPHPYQGPVEALITIERGHIYEHWVQTLETNSEQLEVLITEAMIPNVYVSVAIVKGTDETSPVPSFKMGYIALPIQTTEKELSITLTPDRSADEHYEPGDTVSYDVLVTDSQGDPVEAEIAVSLVDLAVLTLADQHEPAIADYFWRQRGLMVQTASGLTQSGDRVNETLTADAKGLGGGGGAEEFGPVRRRFPDTAYWNPTLRTDANGEAEIGVLLPDNLTTWRLRARGITTETQVGEALVDIISSKDLLVRPVTPRFFVVGDEAELATVVHNNTSHPLDVEIMLEATGLHIGDSASQCVRIPANDNVKVVWPVVVSSTDLASLRFSARSLKNRVCADDQTVRADATNAGATTPAQEELTDAVQISLPVYRYSTPEVVATTGYLDEDGDRLEAIVLPPSYDSTQGELTIQIDPSLAAGMVAGLDYLTHFPYECTEQTVSRFLPNVVTYRALQDLRLSESSELAQELVDRLPKLVSVGVQRLYSQQQLDGGWGWWSRDESDPFLSAYALLGLLEAQRADFPVEEAIITHASEFLHSTLSATEDVEQHRSANEEAFVIYVLAEASQAGAHDKPLSEAITLFRRRETLDTFGKAYLALALDLMEPETASRVNTLLSDISNAAIVSATGAHWEEAQPDYYAMNTDTRSTAIVLAALARLDPDNALAPNTVRWLMATRRDGFWETTQETAWAIIGLADWMVATGELEGAYDWEVAVNSAALGSGSVDGTNIDESAQLQIAVADLLGDAANRVLFAREAPEGTASGIGRMYYGLSLRYYKPVEEVTALNRGIIVSRRYTMGDCDPETEDCAAVDSAQVGDTIRVQLTIIAPNDLHYVVVEDPFPAGTEGVDTSLLTTSVVGEAPDLTRTDRSSPWAGGYGWWWFSQTELRDEKAVLFASYLPRGTYEYSYLIRASLSGEYHAIPTHAYEMYFPEVFGRSDGGLFTISD
ncbi:MAG: alpha-2-macroglobulin, partial [Anaerolineae bacterium]|nr:alpha-2-macroglobulin [Anaerolineae bacterium]